MLKVIFLIRNQRLDYTITNIYSRSNTQHLSMKPKIDIFLYGDIQPQTEQENAQHCSTDLRTRSVITQAF